MGRVERSIEIKASPERVWEMLALDRFPEWDEGTRKNVKSTEYVSEVRTPEDKYRAGTIVRQTENRGKTLDFEITESIENKKITYRTSSWSAVVTIILEPLEERTSLTYAMDYELPYSILGKFLDTLLGQRVVGKDTERSLENLKNILEK